MDTKKRRSWCEYAENHVCVSGYRKTIEVSVCVILSNNSVGAWSIVPKHEKHNAPHASSGYV